MTPTGRPPGGIATGEGSSRVDPDVDGLLPRIDRNVARILEKSLRGQALDATDALPLFGVEGEALAALLSTADVVRRQVAGDAVSFVIVRNINFTNICYTGCRFCAFARQRGDADAVFLDPEQVADRAEAARQRGATEVCLQGGLHPEIDGSTYCNIISAIRRRVPEIHIHAFSPFEVRYGAGRSGLTVRDFLKRLVDHGLDTMPGTAAEILDTDIRQRLTRNKLSAEQWVDVIRTAHGLGIRTTSTIMYGHIDAPHHWVRHIALIRDIQKETGGFTEFVPLGFIHHNAPIYLDGEARPGPTRSDHLRMHAVARLMLRGWIDNIQVSWVKLGPAMARRVLKAGANDLGGTLMEENISRAAGSRYGQEMTPHEMCRLICDIGRQPVQRNTTYTALKRGESEILSGPLHAVP